MCHRSWLLTWLSSGLFATGTSFLWFGWLRRTWHNTHTLSQTSYNPFWIGGGVLGGMSWSVVLLISGTERYVTKCGTLDISWFKTLFLFMFRKMYFYSKTHPLFLSVFFHTVSSISTGDHHWSSFWFSNKQHYLSVYPPSIEYHINTPFLRVRYQVKQTPKTYASTFYDALWHCHYGKKHSCGAGLRRLCKASALKWLFKICSQPFPHKVVMNTFTTSKLKTCSLHSMITWAHLQKSQRFI